MARFPVGRSAPAWQIAASRQINCRPASGVFAPARLGGKRLQDANSAAPMIQSKATGFWPGGWWAIVDYKIGIVPVPVFVVLLAVIAGFALTGAVPSDILMAIVLLSMGGFTCAELGKRIPIIRNIGAAAIFATFIPSYLAFHHLLPAAILASVKDFTKDSNFLYLFISCIIVGSILGMDRGVLVKGFLKIFVPLAAGSVAGGVVGTLVGVLLGLGAYHSFFFVVVPIMAGGVGEGAIPLSIGYAQILHQPQGELFAQVLPPVMLGSLTAILLSGTLNYVGKKYPHLTGEGRLQPGEHDELEFEEDDADDRVDVTTVAAAVVTAVTLYLIGAGAAAARLSRAGGDAGNRGVAEADAGGVADAAGRGFSRLQVLLHRRHLSPAVRHRRRADAVGQAGGRVHTALCRHHRRDGGDDHCNWIRGRGLAEDVSDRHRDRHRLPQRTGRHRRCRHPHRGKSHAADAVCPDRHPDRRRHYRDHGADRPDADRIAFAVCGSLPSCRRRALPAALPFR
jgi:hypothetical protein